jgi:hypothetical protein
MFNRMQKFKNWISFPQIIFVQFVSIQGDMSNVTMGISYYVYRILDNSITSLS